jgi:hypothetical protein
VRQLSSSVAVVRPQAIGKFLLKATYQPELVRQILLFTMLQLKSENRCPDWLYLKLNPVPKSSVINQLDLYLTINFNEQWQNIIGGRVKLGLKGGELRLKLHNCTMPYETRGLTGSLAFSIEKTRQEQAGRKTQSGVKAELSNVAVVPAGAAIAEVKASAGTEQTQEITDEFQFTTCQITTKGSEENPAWAFAVKTGEPVLKGLLNQTSLGILKIKAKPCRVEATFEVSKRDVYLTDAEGLWSPNISRNKRAVLERMIALHLLESQFKPHISRVELHYD